MILFKCDKCKKAISTYVYRLGFEAYSNRDYNTRNPINSPWASPGDKGYVEDELSEKVYSRHLCRECVEKIAAVVLGDSVDIISGGGYRPHTAASRFGKQIRSLSRQRTRTMMAAS